jgi:hypothetical protein
MIEWLVKRIFSWTKLRNAVTSEVHLYDSIGLSLGSGTGALYWSEADGWRGWELYEDKNKYYFYDVPERTLSDVFFGIEEMETA